MTFTEFYKKVMDAPVNTFVYFTGFHYEKINIDLDSEGKYSWSASPNYKITGSVMTTFPMKNSQYVRTFKTEKGAKRSLIKHCSCFFRGAL